MRNNLAIVANAGSPRPELTPARKVLDEHLRLIEDARAVAARALQPCARLRAAIDAERDAEKALQAIVDADAAAMARWAESGEGEMPTARSAEREAAESTLADARQRADAARAVLPQLEQSRNDAERRVLALEQAAEPLIRAVVIEEAEQLSAKMGAALNVACECAEHLNAIDQLTRAAASGMSPAVFSGKPIAMQRVAVGNLLTAIAFDLPGMRPSDLSNNLRFPDMAASQREWLRFADALTHDPSAPAPQSDMEG